MAIKIDQVYAQRTLSLFLFTEIVVGKKGKSSLKKKIK